MPYLKSIVLLFLLSAFVFVPSLGAQDIVIIASPDVPVDTLSASEIKQIFLGKKKEWGNGSKIQFFTSKEAEISKTFLKSFVGKSASQFKTFWKKQVFTGKGKMPKSAASDQGMVDLVTSASGAIGYIAAGSDAGSAKIISVN